MNDEDREFIRKAIQVAQRSKQNGNLPFACILVDDKGNVILEGENSVITDKDSLAHAEINLIRQASGKFEKEFLNQCTIYTSGEPCALCAAAIFWGGIGRLVYGLSKDGFYQIAGKEDGATVLDIPCREILNRGGRDVQVEGPLLEDEARVVHQGFW